MTKLTITVHDLVITVKTPTGNFIKPIDTYVLKGTTVDVLEVGVMLEDERELAIQRGASAGATVRVLTRMLGYINEVLEGNDPHGQY